MTTITIERGLVLKLYIYWLRDVDPAGLEDFKDEIRAVLGVPVTALEQLDPADLCDVCGEPVRYGSRHHACGESVLRANATSSPATAPATAPDELERLRAESEERLQNCAALVAENEHLRKDAERLAWYENNSEKVLNIGPHWYSRKLYNMPMKRRNGFRNAIDAAMEGTP